MAGSLGSSGVLLAHVLRYGSIDGCLSALRLAAQALEDFDDRGGLLGRKRRDHLGNLLLLQGGEEPSHHLGQHGIGTAWHRSFEPRGREYARHENRNERREHLQDLVLALLAHLLRADGKRPLVRAVVHLLDQYEKLLMLAKESLVLLLKLPILVQQRLLRLRHPLHRQPEHDLLMPESLAVHVGNRGAEGRRGIRDRKTIRN